LDEFAPDNFSTFGGKEYLTIHLRRQVKLEFTEVCNCVPEHDGHVVVIVVLHQLDARAQARRSGEHVDVLE
jgi:hypothetical protein